MKFKDLQLHPDLQRGIDEAGYIDCMPVQQQVLGKAFGGQDLYVQSQTGTGKTAAFLVVVFQRLLNEENLSGKKALIMAPTRELAVQIEEEAQMLGKYLPFKTGSFYGGVGYSQQQKLLRDNVQILVGTPGRILDLNKSGQMNLMEIAFLVLDEADRMFDMGFYPDLRKLIKVVPPVDRRQTMLFSATLNAWVKNLAWEYTRSPLEIEIEPEIVTVDEVTQILYHVPSEEKMRLLLGILSHEKPESAIIFCNTKRYTEITAKRLQLNGYSCEFIIGDMPQVKRLKVIEDVKAGKIKMLVATDVAARGLDIEGLAMVVNYDLPSLAENYVHRIGRTARAGKTGKAITFASEHDVYELPPIERYIGKKIPSQVASQELYAQDESSGMHIRTEFYEEPHLHGGARGRTRSAPGRGAPSLGDGRRRDGKRDVRREKQRPNPGENRPKMDCFAKGSSTELTQYPALQGGVVDKKPKPDTEARDISTLSLEERMALYKRKYTGSAGNASTGNASGGNTESRKEPPRQNEKQGGRKGGKDRKRRNSRAGKSPGVREKNGTERKEKPAPLASSSKTGVPAKPAEKKGFFSKILGLFGKK